MTHVACICPTYDRYTVPYITTTPPPICEYDQPSYSDLSPATPIFDGPSLLEEAIQSFLLQDWPHKTLLVLNDNPQVTLDFDHPQVRIINRSQRFDSLGAKYNWGLQIARDMGCTHACSWDDDDISLPWRLSQAAQVIDRTGCDYFKPMAYWFMHGVKPGILPRLSYDHAMHLGLPTGCFSLDAAAGCGDFPLSSNGQDQALDLALRRRLDRPVYDECTPPMPIPLWPFI